MCPSGQRVGGWVIHFPAVVCASSPSPLRSSAACPKRGSLVVGEVRAGVIDQCDIKVPRGIRQVGGRTRVGSSDDLRSTDDGSGHDTSAFPFDLDEGETPSGAAEAEMWAEELPSDSAL